MKVTKELVGFGNEKKYVLREKNMFLYFFVKCINKYLIKTEEWLSEGSGHARLLVKKIIGACHKSAQ